MFDFLNVFQDKEPESDESGEKKESPLAQQLALLFQGCADYSSREVAPGGEADGGMLLLWIEGLVSGSEVAETLLRPLSESRALGRADEAERVRLMQQGVVYATLKGKRDTAKEIAADLLQGCAAVLCGELALTFDTRTQEKRSVEEPSVERSVMGGRDSFTETLRVNTSLLRRRLRTHELKLAECNVGRRSGTRVAVMYLEGIAKTEVVENVERQLEGIDIDGVTDIGDLVQYLAAPVRGLYPQFLTTERPDRLSRLLLQGRVAIMADGLPLALITPGTLPEMLRVAEDRTLHAGAASALLLLRWLSLLLSLLLPALYVAVAMYHQEVIPLRLLNSIIAAKQQVPFSTAVEILGMLVAFELLQEAGLRLPNAAGTTVSIIGTLIVGQSAVDARVISPIAVIVVATAGVAGYIQTNQNLSLALRLWRLLFVLCAVFLGLYGLMAGVMVLLWRLCGIETNGVCYLYPLADGEHLPLLRGFLRVPLRLNKNRDADICGPNRRRQR